MKNFAAVCLIHHPTHVPRWVPEVGASPGWTGQKDLKKRPFALVVTSTISCRVFLTDHGYHRQMKCQEMSGAASRGFQIVSFPTLQ